MKSLVTIILLAGAMSVSAQTPPTTATPTNTVQVTPTPITAAGNTMVGDVAVLADLADLVAIMDKFKVEEKALQDKYNPSWNAGQTKILADIAAVKKANGWGDDVTFDPVTKTWVRTVKTPVAEPKPTAPPTKK